jgi:hypothetical protein
LDTVEADDLPELRSLATGIRRDLLYAAEKVVAVLQAVYRTHAGKVVTVVVEDLGAKQIARCSSRSRWAGYLAAQDGVLMPEHEQFGCGV